MERRAASRLPQVARIPVGGSRRGGDDCAVTYGEVLRLVRSGANVLHMASFEWERVQAWCVALSRDLRVPL